MPMQWVVERCATRVPCGMVAPGAAAAHQAADHVGTPDQRDGRVAKPDEFGIGDGVPGVVSHHHETVASEFGECAVCQRDRLSALEVHGGRWVDRPVAGARRNEPRRCGAAEEGDQTLGERDPESGEWPYNGRSGQDRQGLQPVSVRRRKQRAPYTDCSNARSQQASKQLRYGRESSHKGRAPLELEVRDGHCLGPDDRDQLLGRCREDLGLPRRPCRPRRVGLEMDHPGRDDKLAGQIEVLDHVGDIEPVAGPALAVAAGAGLLLKPAVAERQPDGPERSGNTANHISAHSTSCRHVEEARQRALSDHTGLENHVKAAKLVDITPQRDTYISPSWPSTLNPHPPHDPSWSTCTAASSGCAMLTLKWGDAIAPWTHGLWSP